MIKALPVLGFQGNSIPTNYAIISDWIESAYSDLEFVKEDNPSSVHTRTIGKFTFINSEIEGVQTYVVCMTAKPVGLLLLLRNSDQVWSTETIGILPEVRGQNLGSLLYETALEDLGKIGSSTSLSGGSSKSWRTLCLKHKGVFVIPSHLAPSHKPTEVRIKDWLVENGTTYPVFDTVAGGEMSLHALLRSQNSREQYAAKEGYYLIKAFGSSSKIAEVWPF